MISRKIIFLLFSLFTLINCAGDDMKLNKSIDSLFLNYQGEMPGASVIVIKNGTILFEGSYGLADLDTHKPVDPASNFRLASITKQFTAMAVIQLIAKGKLNFTNSLNDIFPDFPEYGRRIMITHLLNHSSGLIDYESLIPDSATQQVKDIDVFNMMMKQDSTYFEPGSRHKYSNTGYAVLAIIVERLSGKSFAEYLRENIFLPLGMKNTVAYEKGISEVSNRAIGYKYEDDKFVFSDQSITSAVLGDGGIYSSVSELFLWDQALYTEALAGKKFLNLIFTPSIKINDDGLSYGFRLAYR